MRLRIASFALAFATLSVSAQAALTPEQQALADHGKAAVARDLNDPDSVRWRDLSLHGQILCGQMNAKNVYGGYVGYRRFYVFASGTATIEPPVSYEFGVSPIGKIFAGTWNAYWSDAGDPVT